MECVAVEASKFVWAPNSTKKQMLDRFKLMRLMKDMLVQQHVKASNKKHFTRRMIVIGILEKGDTVETMCMSNPRGYVAFLHHHQTFEMPKSWGSFYLLPRMLKHFAILNEIVHLTKCEILQACRDTKSEPEPTLFDIHPTPQTNKRKLNGEDNMEDSPLAKQSTKKGKEQSKNNQSKKNQSKKQQSNKKQVKT